LGSTLRSRYSKRHGADLGGRVVFRKRLARAKVLEFLAGQAMCCGAGGLWRGAPLGSRDRQAGHTVRLSPPAYVKLFIKRQKNDVADAEAICEAAQRPSIRFVAMMEWGAAGEQRGVPGPRPSGAAANTCITPCAGTLPITAMLSQRRPITSIG
jgi:hypothetical protein